MRALSVVIASSILVLTAPVAARAATTSIEDPAGDAANGAKLDITSATLDNRAKGIRVRVDVEKVTSGTLLVPIQIKGQGKVTVISEYDAKEGTVSTLLLSGQEFLPCLRISAAWSTSDDFIRVRLPASCLAKGYDRVRFKAFTENDGGRDVDYAPQAGDDAKWKWSAYVARG
jgi:hypothetical protein